MPSQIETRLALLDAERFADLFIDELGWSRPTSSAITLDLGGSTRLVTAIAEYKGIRVWDCGAPTDSALERKIDAALKKQSAERLLIFHDSQHQQWKWPLSGDSQGRGQSRLVTHEHVAGRKTEALLQRLRQIEIDIDEEPTVVEVLSRLRRAFDAEAVTRSFYTEFAKEHKKLSVAVQGLNTEGDRDWYAALLLNRLMFIYFMQRKGFMDGDLNYLRTRLDLVRHQQGPDKFFAFYSDFLIPLFHEGLGSPARPLPEPEVAALLGDIPYVNGGIFAKHALELNNAINVPDMLFESIFDLFDSYRWHLDDRPSGQPNEINPDVLGFIFEQFINNKEQGAYYTFSDITYYMTSSTLFPVFLDRLQEKTGVNPWIQTMTDPGRYVWDSLSHGCSQPLPPAVQVGWGQAMSGQQADENVGLPGETWAEVLDRRRRHKATMGALSAGDVRSADAAVSHNIDLETLCLDVIDRLDNPDDVLTAWDELTGVRVIDPTCGSGAFLFAGLKILELLYTALLEAAERHVVTSASPRLNALIDKANAHPSIKYFVLKHAAVRNLYGVDLMEEAVEIARLRLFLKLVSAVQAREDLEPLPDLDFNIKVGNILVGALDIKSIATDSTDLFSRSTSDQVEGAAARIAVRFNDFQSATEDGNHAEAAAQKTELLNVFQDVRDVVNRHYHVLNVGTAKPFDEWRSSHVPFHWFIEFPEVFSNGGFDVVIGNPPYVSKGKITRYRYKGFRTDDAPDIYAPCVERAATICNSKGRLGMIVPISSQFSADFSDLRSVLTSIYPNLWVSTFSRNPSALFDAGVGVRSTIIFGAQMPGPHVVHVTKTHRWCEEFRPSLFETLKYTALQATPGDDTWPRVVSAGIQDIFKALSASGGEGLATSVRRSSPYALGCKSIALYWISAFDQEPPSYTLSGQQIPQTAVKGMAFETDELRYAALAVSLSKLALMWWAARGDDFNVTTGVLLSTPVNLRRVAPPVVAELARLGREVSQRLPQHIQYTKYAGKWMGNYVVPELRNLTDQVDDLLAATFGYSHLLGELDLFYWSFYKPTGERPGTLRTIPVFEA